MIEYIIEKQVLPTTIAFIFLATAIILFTIPIKTQSQSVQVKLARLGFAAGKHQWENSANAGVFYCNICKRLMMTGMKQCLKCGLLVHSLCRFKSKPHCKYISAHQEQAQQLHQWQQGNLPINEMCSVCNNLCAGLVSIDCFRCIWCQKSVHCQCRKKLQQKCDFGKLKKWIIEPSQVSSLGLQRKKSKKVISQNSQSQQQRIKIKIQAFKDKNPVVVIINKKSGGQLGSTFLHQFYMNLNPIQIINFPTESLQTLAIFIQLPNIRIIVGGGDGTICAVANYLQQLTKKLNKPFPPIATIPLGTGNDMSRALGWGHDYQQFQIQDLLTKVSQAKPIKLDRWQIEILNSEGQLAKQLYLYNYLGVGLDAKYCLQFHQFRQKYPQLIFSQFSNKVIYGQMGILDLIKKKMKLTKSHQHLEDIVSIKVDGRQVDLGNLQNVVIMNITSWGGGIKPWKINKQNFKHQSFSDQMFQVLGIQHVLHMGQIQLGLDQFILLDQGKQILIEMMQRKQLHIHVDGEPFKLHGPFKVKMCIKDQVSFLEPQQQCLDSQQQKISRQLIRARDQGLIDQKQRETLHRRLCKKAQ